MSDIFISYKREDEARVGRLVRALEGAGHSVWWDRAMGGGEGWRGEIQKELDAAKCVVVAWTHASVGPTASFVHEEAARAYRRGVLVPVALDRVDAPLGFGEIQTVDLTDWKGSSRDPFFEDVLEAVKAKQEGRAVPPAKGPMKRLMRRVRHGSLASAAAFCVAVLGLNLFRVQDRVCGLGALSDLCGAVGLGKRATKTERIAWEGREPGNCAALRTHLERFPDGAYRAEANSLLGARKVTRVEVWTPATRNLALFESEGETSATQQADARAAALAHAQTRAERLCSGFGAATLFRVKSAKPVAQVWNCNARRGGVTCGFEGQAVCELEERSTQERESCGK